MKSLQTLVIGHLLLLLTVNGIADEAPGNKLKVSDQLGTLESSRSYDEFYDQCEIVVPQKIKGADFYTPCNILYDTHDKRKSNIDLKLANFRLETKDGVIIPLMSESFAQVKRADMTDAERTAYNKKKISHRIWIPMDLKSYKGAKIKYNVPRHRMSYCSWGAGTRGSRTNSDTILIARRDAEPYDELARFMPFGMDPVVVETDKTIRVLFSPKYLRANSDLQFSLQTEKNAKVPMICEALSEVRHSKLNKYEKKLKRLGHKTQLHAHRVLFPRNTENRDLDQQLTILNGVDSPWVIQKTGKKREKRKQIGRK